MTVQQLEPISNIFLRKIDEMMNKLRLLRQAVLSTHSIEQPQTQETLTSQLLGALGQAVPGELDYKDDIYEEELFSGSNLLSHDADFDTVTEIQRYTLY